MGVGVQGAGCRLQAAVAAAVGRQHAVGDDEVLVPCCAWLVVGETTATTDKHGGRQWWCAELSCAVLCRRARAQRKAGCAKGGVASGSDEACAQLQPQPLGRCARHVQRLRERPNAAADTGGGGAVGMRDG